MGNPVVYNLKKKFRNKLPFVTKFPLDMIVYKIVNGNQLVFNKVEPIRKSVNNQGDDCYILKHSANEILSPAVGSEDASGNLLAVQVGEGDYRFIKQMELDEASKSIVLSLHDDETMKYQFANVCKEAAFRYRPEEKWYNSFMIGLLIFGIIIVIMIVIANMAMSGQLAETTKSWQTSANGIINAVNGLSGKMGGVIPTVVAPPA